MIVPLFFVLAACGGLDEEALVGHWQLIEGGEETNIWEITEEELTIRSQVGDVWGPMDYTVLETDDEHFEIEVIEPINNTEFAFFKGYFENQDTIKSVGYDLGDFELVRIDEDEVDEQETVEEESLSVEDEIEVEQEYLDVIVWIGNGIAEIFDGGENDPISLADQALQNPDLRNSDKWVEKFNGSISDLDEILNTALELDPPVRYEESNEHLRIGANHYKVITEELPKVLEEMDYDRVDYIIKEINRGADAMGETANIMDTEHR